MLNRLGKWKWLILAAIFGSCAAPTFISYQRYLFSWDDADYLTRSIEVSRAFWSWNVHGLGAMVSIRPPAMALLGLPWRGLTSWDAAGRCFITLDAAISLLVATCLYLLLRIGVKPVYLAAASLCILASLGPFPPSMPYFSLGYTKGAALSHFAATAFLADSLLAWTAFAAVLLIPYEARTNRASMRDDLLHGILWGAVLSVGALTKLDFLYFVVLIAPTLFVIRLFRWGSRSALATFAAFTCCSVPAGFYLLHWGKSAFENAKAASFGGDARMYFAPFPQFLSYVIRESPGLLLSLVLTVGALVYLVARRRKALWQPTLPALLIMIGFAIIAMASPNREIRFAFPAIVALPFLAAILMSQKTDSAPARSAALAAGLVFCGLLAAGMPTRRRANEASITRSSAVLAQAGRCQAKSILLLTDSPTLNRNLMELALTLSGREVSAGGVEVSSLAYPRRNQVPIEVDFRAIRGAGMVVFQDTDKLSPPFTNQRASAYEQYLRQSRYVPIRLDGDVNVYPISCGELTSATAPGSTTDGDSRPGR
jgi:hypothetical protein